MDKHREGVVYLYAGKTLVASWPIENPTISWWRRALLYVANIGFTATPPTHTGGGA